MLGSWWGPEQNGLHRSVRSYLMNGTDGAPLRCRTLKPEATDPGSTVSNTSREAVLRFLDTVPASLKEEAQAFRVERANKAKA